MKCVLILLLLSASLSAQIVLRGGTRSSGTIGSSTGGTPPTCNPPNTIVNGVCTPPVPVTPENLYCSAGDVESFPATDHTANLPTSCIYTAMSGSPSPGALTPVANSAALTSALSAAACGDTLILAAGTTYTGNWTLPAKGCDATHWITIRTDQIANGAFPAEGTRATPCEIGLATVTDYPNYPCASPVVRMPTLRTAVTNGAVFTAAIGADHYRLIGLNLTVDSSTRQISNKLLDLTKSDHVIVDRVLCHGVTWVPGVTGMVQGCVLTQGANSIAVINSWFYDTYCGGICIDSNAISGGLASTPEGTIKIYNNLIASGGESFIYGGAGNTTIVPHDFEIRNNHSFKPLSWYMAIAPNGGGGQASPSSTKNLGEFKNGIRALIEGNVFENSFSGWQTDQSGYCFLLTPKSQSGTSPAVRVLDITFRYNHCIRSGRGISIAIVTTSAPNPVPDGLALRGISIHDNVIEGISSALSSNNLAGVNGGHTGFDFNSGVRDNPIANVFLDHNTVIGLGGNGTHGGIAQFSGQIDTFSPSTNFMEDFTVTNNLGIGGMPGANSLSSGAIIAPAMTGYNKLFSPTRDGTVNGDLSIVMSKNVMGVGLWTGQSSDCASQAGQVNCWLYYPTTNDTCGGVSHDCFLTGQVFKDVFVDFNNFHDGDYHLKPASPYKLAGTDSKDIGADWTLMEAATAGVRSTTTYLPLAITSTTVPSGIVGTAYTATQLTASAGAGPFKYWSVTSGVIPTSMALQKQGLLLGTPTAAGTFNFTVQAEDYARQVDTQDFSVQVAPALTSISPTSGIVGDSITLTGAGFGATQGTSSISFNNGVNASSITSWSATSIVVVVPTGTVTGVVRVSVNSVYSAGITFTLTPPPGSPAITSLTPAVGVVGSSVAIAGSNFGATQGASTVTFNGVTATCPSWSATALTCLVP